MSYEISQNLVINTTINRKYIITESKYMSEPKNEDMVAVPPAMQANPEFMESAIPQQQDVAINPLLSRVEMPGSTFQLPSRGLFYDNGELRGDVEMGEVHVHPMSAFDEILMKTPDALFSGEAVHKVFLRCIPQILKPTELLAKDVDFLLVCLRQVTYGDEMDIRYIHNCKDAKNHQYTINISTFLQKAKKIDPTTLGNTYTTTLPNGQIIKLHPSKFKDVIKMYQDVNPDGATPEEELAMTVFVIKSIIHSVDEVTDERMIEEWIKKIPAGWLADLSKIIDKASDFGPNFTFKTICKDCGEEIEIESPINPISFFT